MASPPPSSDHPCLVHLVLGSGECNKQDQCQTSLVLSIVGSVFLLGGVFAYIDVLGMGSFGTEGAIGFWTYGGLCFLAAGIIESLTFKKSTPENTEPTE